MQFDQFSGQSFEQLVQALSTHVFGAGVTVFGPGRDGGREATFRGALPTFEGKGWNGYTVIQAKCKERPSGDARDAAWLSSQLRGELQKFLANKELERPEYYLLCSNVQLSAVPNVGGKQLIDNIFEEFKVPLGLKGWHVWSADELRSLLANAPNVRRTFGSWITPGDILFELMDQLVGHDLVRSLPTILAKDLRTDRDARLRDAGQETEQAVYLEKVFIDLPVDLPIEFRFPELIELSEEGHSNDGEAPEIHDLFDEEDDFTQDVTFEEQEDNCVTSLFQLAADRLDPKSVDGARKSRRWALRNRVVLLGGPGQGKSTMGQFVVQLARARLLAASERLTLNPDTHVAVTQICNAAKALGIPLEGPARIPVRVDLPMLADEISKQNQAGLSVLSFIASRYTATSGQTVSVSAVEKLLQEFPWIIIFDGLDEVPPSANRREVIKAIEAFWDEVYNVGGDVLAVVTSRPQGYDNDLSPQHWQHWNLLPLSPKYALEYATKLGDIRVSEADRKEKILDDIRNACADPSTALLTTSPLQVTILFGISFLKGSIPQDRWELFDRYYNLLREREAQKPGGTAKFIRDHKRTIDELHQTCGWILQAEAEAPGRTVSFLTDVQFKGIIEKLLKDEGYEGSTVADLADRLASIATDRLVLLASRVEGQVSFDVRSLQEYMAAAKLVGSDQKLLIARLRTIAPSAHWRHVFRIAASKIFSIAEMGHLRDDVVAICDALDMGDLHDSGSFVGAGATLALDLLADGISANAPKFFRRLLTRAIVILDMDREGYDARIAGVAELEKGSLVFEEIEARLGRASASARRNSVAALLSLQNTEQGKKLMDRFLSTAPPAVVLNVLGSLDVTALSKKQRECLRNIQKEAGELSASTFAFSVAGNEREAAHSDWLFAPELARSLSHVGQGAVVVGITENTVTRFSSLESMSRIYNSIDRDLDPARWPTVTASRIFLEESSPASLAEAVRFLRGVDLERAARIRYEIPWPLRALMSEIREGQDASALADAAAGGTFGDQVAWMNAEGRWREKPVAASEYRTWNSGFYLAHDIGTIGPPPLSNVSTGAAAGCPKAVGLLKIASKMLEGPKKELLLWHSMVSFLRAYPEFPERYAKLFLETFFSSDVETLPLSRRRARIFSLGARVWSDRRVQVLAHRYGLAGLRITCRSTELVDAFNADPSLRGLLAHASATMSHPWLSKIDSSAFVEQNDDPSVVKAGVALMRLRYNKLEGVNLEHLAVNLVEGTPLEVTEAARALKSLREPDDEVRQKLAYELAKQMKLRSMEPRGPLLDLLRANVSAALTGLTQGVTCDELGLPCL